MAQLVTERKTLLVLDGVEPLQYPPGPVGGQLKDPALEALLKGLAQHNSGLCIVTTREPLTDLDGWMDKTLAYLGQREHPHDRYANLSHLSAEAGAQLLFDAGVDKAGGGAIEADDKELKDAAREVDGHALTLQLLGRYLARSYDGDVRKRDLVGFQKADAKTQGGHAFRMLAAYEKWFAGAGEEGQRQLAVLQLLGLFDRPADAGCITALRQEPGVAGLTEPLIALDDDDWNYTLSSLRESALITVHADDSAIDAHPLVRDYFGKQLRKKKQEAWQTAHRRLYEYLTENTEHRPDTLAGLQPLYQAVAHGCLAGMHEEACTNVYRERILRGTDVADGYYNSRRLGAFGSDLGAVACFFEIPWAAVSHELSEINQVWLVAVAAFDLRAVGRLAEAREIIGAGLSKELKREDWGNAAISANNLSELQLILGDIAKAVQDAQRSVEYADRTGRAFLQTVFRTALARALFQAGEVNEATGLFREAEAMQAENQPEYPLLYSVQGFLYCDLLLTPAEHAAWQRLLNLRTAICNGQTLAACDAAEQRATKTLEWARQARKDILSAALDDLSLGRAALYRAILNAKSQSTSHESLGRAVDGIRTSGNQDEVPRALLARALLRFVEENRDGCRADLDEAWQIAERGSMKLYMADVHLHRARLFRDKKVLAKARKLIDECGYHRRDPELQDAEQAAQNW